ncbi:hypothetical protein DINM_002051 [Dirofilaria immitis]|nr:hypothetical protein [Dirofilaria immitis]
MHRYICALLIIMSLCFEMILAVFTFRSDCVTYAKNHTICATMEACKSVKCAPYHCEKIPAIYFRNIVVMLNKRFRNKPRYRERLNPLLHDPLKTSISTQEVPGVYCGKRNKLLRNVKIKAMLAEGIFQQLLRKASFVQQRYLYARDDCLNMCHVLGIDLGCEMVPDDDIEVIKTAVFKHLQHMVFFQCGEFPILMAVMVILVATFIIIVILELVIGMSRIRAAKKRSKMESTAEDKDELTTEPTSVSTTKSQMTNKSASNENVKLNEAQI